MKNTAGKTIMKTSGKKAGKLLGSLSSFLSSLDAVAMVGKVTDSTIPIIDKAIDRHHERQNSLLRLDNLIHMNVNEAKEHLEKQGFVVSTILAKPSKAYQNCHLDEVVAMSPKSGKLPAGSLVKLYYVNQEILEQSQRELVLPDVLGIPVAEAQEILTTQGFQVVLQVLAAKKELAQAQADTVLTMSPKPNMLPQAVRTGSLVKLGYLDEEGLLASQDLAQADKERQLQRQQKIKDSLNQVGQLFNKKKE